MIGINKSVPTVITGMAILGSFNLFMKRIGLKRKIWGRAVQL